MRDSEHQTHLFQARKSSIAAGGWQGTPERGISEAWIHGPHFTVMQEAHCIEQPTGMTSQRVITLHQVKDFKKRIKLQQLLLNGRKYKLVSLRIRAYKVSKSKMIPGRVHTAASNAWTVFFKMYGLGVTYISLNTFRKLALGCF